MGIIIDYDQHIFIKSKKIKKTDIELYLLKKNLTEIELNSSDEGIYFSIYISSNLNLYDYIEIKDLFNAIMKLDKQAIIYERYLYSSEYEDSKNEEYKKCYFNECVLIETDKKIKIEWDNLYSKVKSCDVWEEFMNE